MNSAFVLFRSFVGSEQEFDGVSNWRGFPNRGMKIDGSIALPSTGHTTDDIWSGATQFEVMHKIGPADGCVRALVSWMVHCQVDRHMNLLEGNHDSTESNAPLLET
jgi:hypothetical protein